LGEDYLPNRYIVELSEEPALSRSGRAGGRFTLQADSARQQLAKVRAEQRSVRLQLQRLSATVIESVATVANALSVRIPDHQAAALAGIPGVRYVYPVRLFHLNLDHALPLHKVTDAWNLVGVDGAGLGVKIAMIDTGIDISHPGLQDPSLPIPDGYPKVNTESDQEFTNQKVIVARSYASMLPEEDPDLSARDHVGHGTATAMAAAGVQNSGPLAIITGVAPRAYLGSYKVFGSPEVNDKASEDAILKAIDDAVSDGMDVINLSLGSDLAMRPADDLEVRVLERVVAAGVIVVAAAGNNGPDPSTIATPATAPSVISVGSSANDRVFSTTASVNGIGTYAAIPGTGPAPEATVTAPLVDVASLDNDGMACSALPEGSLQGRIALILRGSCLFEEKLHHAGQAGAVGALVYTDQERPDPITMVVGAATLPAEMVSYANGVEIKRHLGEAPQGDDAPQASLSFTLGPLWTDPNRVARFSARGPNLEGSIKPDLVAVGMNLYTAAQTGDLNGALYSDNGYVEEQGTSFSAPLVAGAAALLKAARPGLTAAQYRSLLINSAAPIAADGVTPARVQQAGAGLLNLSAALRSTAAFSPTALNFGVGRSRIDLMASLAITNLGAAAESFQLAVVPRDDGPAPALPADVVRLEGGQSATLRLRFATGSLPPGEYEGFVTVQGVDSGVESRIPYWYAVSSETPEYITLLHTASNLTAGSTSTNAILFRISDASGIPLFLTQPEVSPISGGGEVVRIRTLDGASPGLFGADVLLGSEPGPNVFRIQAGAITRDVTLSAN
jgi:subtilisin family serine protease